MSFGGAESTYSVSALCDEIKSFLGAAFSGMWVAGEVQRLKPSQRGHLYFELVEKGARDEVVGKLDAVLWRNDHLRVARTLAAAGQTLAEGQQIRCRASVDFWGPGGRLQLVVSEIDPVFTLGLLAQRRQETLAALAASGLLERNRQLELPALPLTLGLVTSHGSAAYHDFVTTLTESGYGFRVLFVHAAVQGREAEGELVSALALLARRAVDCAVLIRGGGSRTDLAAFDSRLLAEAIARSPLPVLTGLGHEIDQSIADLVANAAFKTPTKVAEFLVERARAADLALAGHAAALRRLAFEPLRRAREGLVHAERGMALARLRLAAAGARLGELARALGRVGRGRLRAARGRRRERAERLARLAPRVRARGREEPRRLGERLVAGARARLREAVATVDGLARLAAGLDPRRTLDRGFSITRAAGGRLVRSPAAVAPGERITTQLAGGVFASRVEEP